MDLLFDKSVVSDWPTLLAAFSDDELPRPTRSTVPLLDLLINHPEETSQVFSSIGVSEPHSLAHEYKVRPPIGTGGDSQSDLVAIAKSSSACIEAKWNEPRYETVGDWLQRGRSETNRRAVIQGWLSLLSPFATREMSLPDVEGVVYQTLHRAASAATLPNPRLTYLAFVPKHDSFAGNRSSYASDLRDLAVSMGDGQRLPMFHVKVEIRPTARFNELEARLPSAALIRAALIDGPLFDIQGTSTQAVEPVSELSATR